MNEKIFVIGYARVSSSKQAGIGEGLELQEAAIKRHCKEKGWTLFPEDKVFLESHTGSKIDRPVYNYILEVMKSNYKRINLKYLVFWDFDRLTRAGLIDYDQIWKDMSQFNISLRDTTNVIQDEINTFAYLGLNKTYDFAIGRPSEDTERKKIEDARIDKKRILKKLIEPEIHRVREGYHIGNTDYGFRVERIYVENKKKCIQVRYQPEAEHIELIYKLRSEGILTDKEIVENVNAQGYRSRTVNKWNKEKTKIIGTKGGVVLTEKHLAEIIKRPVYCGVIKEEWTNHLPIYAKYKGLVCVEVWNKANKGKVFLQENNDGRLEFFKNIGVHGKKRYKYNPKFPYKGVLKCDLCGKIMKGSSSTGKSKAGFPVYHCERGHKRKSYKLREVHQAFQNLFENINFTPDFISILEKTLLWQFNQKEGESALFTAKANQNVSELETQKSNLIKSLSLSLDNETRSDIQQELSKLRTLINEAKHTRDENELREQDIIEFTDWCKKIMEHPYRILEDIRSSDEQRELFRLFFEELPSYNEVFSGTPKMTFVFKVNSDFINNKSDIAGDEFIFWNQVAKEISYLNRLFD